MGSQIDDFTANVKEIFEVQDQIRSIAADAKERRGPLKERADILEGSIRTYMEEKNIGVCNFHDERLELKTLTRFGSLTKKSLGAALAIYFNDETKAQECFDSIMNHIGSKEVTVLKRLKNRKRKNSPSDQEPPSKKQNMEDPPDLSDDDEDTI